MPRENEAIVELNRCYYLTGISSPEDTDHHFVSHSILKVDSRDFIGKLNDVISFQDDLYGCFLCSVKAKDMKSHLMVVIF